jgi:hypothetical protein
MVKKTIKVEVNNFVQGLITEASPLNFPPNATVDESNFVLNSNGTRERRLGLDLEDNFDLIPYLTSIEAMNENPYVPFKWTNVGGNSNDNFLVVQNGLAQLSIFNLGVDSISGTGAIGLINLSALGFNSRVPYSFAAVNGRLIIAAGSADIAILSYKAGLFYILAKPILVRDVWGVEVQEDKEYERDVQYRSLASASYDTHIYNLYNQSWGTPKLTPADGFQDTVQVYLKTGLFPSNSETVWPGMQFQPVQAGQAPSEVMYYELYQQVFGADIKAAKGHYTIDLLRRGNSRVENVVRAGQLDPVQHMKTFNTVPDITPGGATTVCEFAGRVFYAGFSGDVVGGDARSPSLSNYLVFSQLVKNTDDITKCYQAGDPTSRESNDLVETDGGFIRLSGAEGIVGMVNLGSALVAFAKNGVWVISGGNDYGFSATNYKAERISTFGAISRNSIVQDGARALYWSEDGIYAVVRDQFGSYTAQNITQKTIQSLYDEIPSVSKSKAVGVFDPVGKKLRWVYHTGQRFTASSSTKELILDLTLGAFYQFNISNLADYSAEVLAPFTSVPFIVRTDNSDVMVGSDAVYSGTDTVKTPSTLFDSSLQTTRYLVVRVVGSITYMSFGFYSNFNFVDWESLDGVGVDAPAHLVTGAVTAGDSSVEKQMPYLTLHFYRTETGVDTNLVPLRPSACLVQSQWDWANSANSNKWSSKFQGYRQRKAYLAADRYDPYDTGFELVTTKNKIRGRGRAFALRMETEPLKDCQIVGWSIALNGNPNT